jgi:TPR repeat protein
MSSARTALFASLGLLAGACGLFRTPGYSPSDPTEITCGCHDGVTCYEGAAALASSRGENAGTAEELMYFAQCACFQGSTAGCNTLAHFAKDWVAACARDEKVADACTIAGMVHLHGVRVPSSNGRSFPRDDAAARAAFERACKAGSQVACAKTTR